MSGGRGYNDVQVMFKVSISSSCLVLWETPLHYQACTFVTANSNLGKCSLIVPAPSLASTSRTTSCRFRATRRPTLGMKAVQSKRCVSLFRPCTHTPTGVEHSPVSVGATLTVSPSFTPNLRPSSFPNPINLSTSSCVDERTILAASSSESSETRVASWASSD